MSVFWEPIAGHTRMMGSCEPKVRLLYIVGKTMNKDILGHCVHFGTSLSSKADWKMMCGWFLMCNKQSSVFRLASVFKHFILKHDVDFNYVKLVFSIFLSSFLFFFLWLFFLFEFGIKCKEIVIFKKFDDTKKKNTLSVFYSKIDKNI